MRNVFAKLKTFLFVLVCCILCDPLIVRAAGLDISFEETGPVSKGIAIVVFIVVTYKMYRFVNRNTVFIGTREGINKAKISTLTIPLFCGAIASVLVTVVINFLKSILPILIICVVVIIAIIAVLVIIYKVVSKKGNASEKIISEQQDSKAITDDGMAVYENEIQDTDDGLRSIISKLDIHEMYDETGMPITKGALLEKARKNLGIPSSENVYLIHDDTIFCSCKTGFAICESGIYSRLKQNRYIPWAEFKTTQITNSDFLRIGEDQYYFSGKIGDTPIRNIVYEALVKIQESIE